MIWKFVLIWHLLQAQLAVQTQETKENGQNIQNSQPSFGFEKIPTDSFKPDSNNEGSDNNNQRAIIKESTDNVASANNGMIIYSSAWGWLGKRKTCLTGYMTDVQNWVDENGNLTPFVDQFNSIDVSRMLDPVNLLEKEVNMFNQEARFGQVRYLSLAKCNLLRVPTVFNMRVRQGKALFEMIEYLTLYGNNFSDLSINGEDYSEFLNATNAHELPDVHVSKPDIAAWGVGFNYVTFQRLKQLDLRQCKIQQLSDDTFINMPKLEALYLGENSISFISAFAFNGLNNLLHLDLSRNLEGSTYDGVSFEHGNVFDVLKNLVSLDLSFTKIQQRGVNSFKTTMRNLTRLSLCYASINQLPADVFNETNLMFLDVSGNNGILSKERALQGLEKSLTVLFATEIGLKNIEQFYNFKKLKILHLDGNEIATISPRVTKTLRNLTVLSLDRNRLTTWFENVFVFMDRLQFLSLRSNNINLISSEMIRDIQNVSYLGLAGNFMVCNCHSREFFELVYRNQKNQKSKRLVPLKEDSDIGMPFSYHTGYKHFNAIIEKRKDVKKDCDKCREEEIESEGKFVIFDFSPQEYQCLQFLETKNVPFWNTSTCVQSRKQEDLDANLGISWTLLMILILVPAILLSILALCFIFRRNLRYFCITIRNSATLSLINNDNNVDDDTIFNYDVFVSYCNEDRNWVLDHLLPHVEKDCNVSVCLHERDFQVGLSILENIVSCMDRSRFIMLILSQQFLKSQWCQFEMHLAQHRLLETRREDLVLVLLEDIPRRLRPTTLHYLMLTKTYIVWPRQESERPAFWKRLTRSLIRKRQDNVSVA